MKNKYLITIAAVWLLVLVSASALAAPTVDAIIDNATKNLEDVNSISFSLKVTTYDENGNAMTIEGNFQAIFPDLIRLTYTKPDFLSGQIMVVDREAEEARVYMPVTDQIMVTSLAQMAEQQGLSFQFEDMISLPDKENFTFQLLEEGARNGEKHYVIQVEARDGKTSHQKLWINASSFWVSRVEFYGKNGDLQTTVELQNLSVNPELSPAELRKLPEGAEIVHQ